MGRYVRNLCFLILLLGLFINVRGVYAEDGRVAILYTSPRMVKGIGVLPPNAIPNYYALYRIGRKTFRVIYTESPIVIPRSWKRKYCLHTPVFVVSDGAEYKGGVYSLFYRDGDGGYSLFFVFDSKAFGLKTVSKDDFVCKFVTKFIREFKFFMQFRKYKTDIPFPAVIELGG